MHGYKGTIFITFGNRKAKNDELYIQESKAKVEVVVGAGSRGAGQGSGDAGAVMRNLSDPGGQQPSPALSPLLQPVFRTTVCFPTTVLPPPPPPTMLSHQSSTTTAPRPPPPSATGGTHCPPQAEARQGESTLQVHNMIAIA